LGTPWPSRELERYSGGWREGGGKKKKKPLVDGHLSLGIHTERVMEGRGRDQGEGSGGRDDGDSFIAVQQEVVIHPSVEFRTPTFSGPGLQLALH